MPMPVVVTIVRGRHTHLRRQREWLAQCDPQPLGHVVVAMGDVEVASVLDAHPVPCPTTLELLPDQPELPLSKARNVGVRLARDQGGESVILLDVDCLPEPGLVGDYARALQVAGADQGGRPVVICGRVRYLPEGLNEADHTASVLDQVSRDHPARVVPEGEQLVEGDPRLLWSLNLAVGIEDWDRIGGFDERFVGYGGEDTDFGQRLAAAGGSMLWTSSAGVFHQYHPTQNPPVQHAAAIARNVNLFRTIWGFEPMEGWLTEFERRGVLRRVGQDWQVA